MYFCFINNICVSMCIFIIESLRIHQNMNLELYFIHSFMEYFYTYNGDSYCIQDDIHIFVGYQLSQIQSPTLRLHVNDKQCKNHMSLDIICQISSPFRLVSTLFSVLLFSVCSAFFIDSWKISRRSCCILSLSSVLLTTLSAT